MPKNSGNRLWLSTLMLLNAYLIYKHIITGSVCFIAIILLVIADLLVDIKEILKEKSDKNA